MCYACKKVGHRCKPEQPEVVAGDTGVETEKDKDLKQQEAWSYVGRRKKVNKGVDSRLPRGGGFPNKTRWSPKKKEDKTNEERVKSGGDGISSDHTHISKECQDFQNLNGNSFSALQGVQEEEFQSLASYEPKRGQMSDTLPQPDVPPIFSKVCSPISNRKFRTPPSVFKPNPSASLSTHKPENPQNSFTPPSPNNTLPPHPSHENVAPLRPECARPVRISLPSTSFVSSQLSSRTSDDGNCPPQPSFIRSVSPASQTRVQSGGGRVLLTRLLRRPERVLYRADFQAGESSYSKPRFKPRTSRSLDDVFQLGFSPGSCTSGTRCRSSSPSYGNLCEMVSRERGRSRERRKSQASEFGPMDRPYSTSADGSNPSKS